MSVIDQALGDDGRQLHVAFSAEASDVLRVMAASQGLTVIEVVRRAVGVYRMGMALAPDEALMIMRADGTLERVVLDRERPEGDGGD